MQVNPKIVRYIDMPLQHADDAVLKLMNRKGTGDGYLALIEKLRREVKGIAIRSTFITGFPRESEDAFNNLVNFLTKLLPICPVAPVIIKAILFIFDSFCHLTVSFF